MRERRFADFAELAIPPPRMAILSECDQTCMCLDTLGKHLAQADRDRERERERARERERERARERKQERSREEEGGGKRERERERDGERMKAQQVAVARMSEADITSGTALETAAISVSQFRVLDPS